MEGNRLLTAETGTSCPACFGASVARTCFVGLQFFALASARRLGSLLPPHGMAGDGSHVQVAASVP